MAFKEDQEAKREIAEAQKLKTKAVYGRLMKNEDFKIFYKYLETCYNSYMDQAGAIQLPKEQRDFVSDQANAFYKVIEHIKRQAS